MIDHARLERALNIAWQGRGPLAWTLRPLAWLFARRLSRPMHEFATAADAIGRDEQAPLVDQLVAPGRSPPTYFGSPLSRCSCQSGASRKPDMRRP